MKKTLIYLLIVAAMAFVACGDEPDDPVTPTEDKNLSGSITGSKTLDASVEYLLVGPLIVEEGGVLTIPAGTTIKAKKRIWKLYISFTRW